MKSIYGDRTADLGKELDAIDAKNVLFWKRGANNSREARVQHQLRLNRLDEIMKELASVAEACRKSRHCRKTKAPKRAIKKQFSFHATNAPENSALDNGRALTGTSRTRP
jgi:hypothetical protein